MAKYTANLNNYQMGSEFFKTYQENVIATERLTAYCTKVIWDLDDQQYQHLQSLFGLKKLEKIGD